MSNVNNLHSLLGDKWMITDEYASSLTPYLISILTKGTFPIPENLTKGEAYCFLNSSGEFIGESSTDEEPRIAVLNVKGPILKYSQMCGPMGTIDMKNKMEEWKTQNNIAGVFMDFDTGGGQFAGTPLFAEYVHEYNKTKPVIGYTEGTIASAGLYIASGCKEIIAHKHAMCIGSLGTMSKYIDTDGIIEKMGGKVIEEYAEKSTKKNYASREAKKGNPKPLIKDELNPLNEKFHKEILTYMPSIKPEALNGQHTYNIKKAKKMGLITKIADRQYAIDRIFELAETSNNNKSDTDMSGESTTYEAIAAAIGAEEIKTSKKLITGKTGVFMTESQLDLLTSKLEGHNEAVAAVQKTADDFQADVQTEKDKITAIETAVTTSLETADLDAGENTEASIKLLGDKVAEYGKQPGTKPTKVISKEDRKQQESESYGIWNSITS